MIAHSNSILSSVIMVFEKSKGSKLEDSVLIEVEDALKRIGEFLNIDKTEALFFSLIFSLQNQDNANISFHKIADYLEYPFLRLLEYRYVVDSLEEKSLIYLDERRNVSHHPENNGYMVTGSVSNSVIEGKDMIFPEKKEITIEDVIYELIFIEDNYNKDVMNDTEYFRQIILFERKHKNIDLIKKITEMFPNDFDSRILLYYFSYSAVFGEEFFEPEYRNGKYVTAAFNCLSNSSCIKRRKDLFSRTDILLKKNLLEINCIENVPRYGTINSFRLTVAAIKTLFGSEANRFAYNDELTELDMVICGIREIANKYEEKESRYFKLSDLIQIEKEFYKYSYFKKVKGIIKNDTMRFIYLDCVNDFLIGHDSNIGKTLQDIYGKSPDYFSELHSLIDEKHFLVESGFLEITKNDIVERSTMSLTEKSIELLYGEHTDLYYKKGKLKNVLQPEEIKLKNLFYESNIKSQIEMLNDSLNQDNLLKIQSRLESKGLCKGVAIILYGAPGTGKTETVYQLAKSTNRKIFHVDISESKSMWFGESEKCIKKIFSDYKALCKSCKDHNENTPILLFNEADAIISKRGSLDGGGPRQTENAMQNILLEEMEKLGGIMIATTNLCENMDAAFERRFLFKIKFDKPTVESRSKIWMSKLESLSDNDACSLATQFDFSGGEIDNIVRKCEMNEIITGEKPDYNHLIELCKQERLQKEGERRMGFFC